jgi:hypothetical protein
VNIVSQVGRSRENRPNWLSLDSVLGAPELHELCSKLGFAPPVWHKTDEFVARVNSSVHPDCLEREWHVVRGENASLTDPIALGTVLDDAEKCFQGGAKRAQNTQEFEEVIQLIQRIRALLVQQKPIQTSLIGDLISEMWCGRNWERLPEPLYERKMVLDGVLRDVGLSRERPRVWGFDMRSFSLARAAQAYLANDWMHTRWLTTLLARDMLFNLRSSLQEREKRRVRWWVTLTVAGGVLACFEGTRTLGVVLCLAGVGGYATEFRAASTLSELDRIISEIESGFYSGSVLAERLERRNRSGCDVPSVLIGVLRVQPGGECKR